MDRQEGITIVALIITIVILLIISVVAIGGVQDSGIIGYAQDSKEGYTVEQEKERISVALNEWTIQKYTQVGTTFAEYMQGKIEGATVTDNGDGTITVEFKNNAYKVTEYGDITEVKGVRIIAEGFPLKIEEGKAMPTGTLKATLVKIKGTISWSIEDENIATISAEEGEQITVTAVKKGETKVTATCGEYSEEYTVKITEKVGLAKGVFVEYDVAYTDSYMGYQYTTTNGWRLIDYTKNADGTYSNVKLISTGIPAMLSNHYGGSDYSWWATDDKILSDFRSLLGGDEYIFYTGDSTYKALQASAGLYYNFKEIKFAYGAGRRGANLGYFTSITSNGTTYDVNNTEEKNGGDLFNLYGNNATVRLLTLPELNKARGINDVDSKKAISDKTGLYELESISTAGIGLDSNTYTSGNYWLASPYPTTSNDHQVIDVDYCGTIYGRSLNYCSYGVRPVVCISSNVKLEDTNEDGVFEIK